MEEDLSSSFPLIIAGIASLFVYVVAAAAAVLEEEEYAAYVNVAAQVIASSLVSFRSRKHGLDGNDDDNLRVSRRRLILWDRDRASRCIEQDYLGTAPSFGLDDFKRIFRVSRSTYDSLKRYLIGADGFFREGLDVTGRKRVGTDSKILIALKYLGYGCSVNAFRDYFQLGESTAMLAVKKFTSCISTSPFQKKYFSFFTSSDAKKVERLHHRKHGVRGMLGSLDCSHFVWGNCPVAHHGQFQGKEGKPTIVVETLADHNLYAWHAVFGYCGTLNDLSIWDSSYLLQSLCDGSFSDLDFPFKIGGELFEELWMLVDGIYPSLARFVKPISVPVGKREALFAMWQESKRKDIERFFGVFKRKYWWFNRPIPFGYMEDIIHVFYCCVILHNIAVTERLNAGEEEVESDSFYDCVQDAVDCAGAHGETQLERLAREYVLREEEDIHQRNLDINFLAGLGINVLDSSLAGDMTRLEVLPQLERVAQVRWSHLYNVSHHNRLTKAIMKELKTQYNEYKKNLVTNN